MKIKRKSTTDLLFDFMAVEGLASPKYAAMCKRIGFEPWGPPATEEDVRRVGMVYFMRINSKTKKSIK